MCLSFPLAKQGKGLLQVSPEVSVTQIDPGQGLLVKFSSLIPVPQDTAYHEVFGGLRPHLHYDQMHSFTPRATATHPSWSLHNHCFSADLIVLCTNTQGYKPPLVLFSQDRKPQNSTNTDRSCSSSGSAIPLGAASPGLSVAFCSHPSPSIPS